MVDITYIGVTLLFVFGVFLLGFQEALRADRNQDKIDELLDRIHQMERKHCEEIDRLSRCLRG